MATVSSHIFPFLVGDSHESVRFSECLKRKGFYALPVRPPTVLGGNVAYPLLSDGSDDGGGDCPDDRCDKGYFV